MRPALKDTAYHEAGHAVVAVALGYPFGYVTIKPKPGSLGSILHPTPLMIEHETLRERRAIARECILISFAGYAAESFWNPSADPKYSSEDEGNAFETSRQYCVFPRYLSYVGDDRHLAYLERLRREARRIVQAHWPCVEAVAHALLRRRTLTGDEVKAIADRVAMAG